MAKNKFLSSPSALSLSATDLIGVSPADRTPLMPAITGVKPCGSQVLVEVLTPQELMNTPLTISEKTDLKVPLQGYVRAVGPGVKTDDWGFTVGDRVLISTSGAVMAPNYNGIARESFFMEPHAIKSVISEA